MAEDSSGGRRAAARRSFVARDPAMLDVVEALERAAQTDAPVLLVGELGVGKGVMGRWVHDASPRRDGPFVALGCGSMPPTVAETILFGREPGDREPAIVRHLGVFEEAHGGTLLLDSIDELPRACQRQLARVLDERALRRVGGTAPVPVDVRIVSASRRDLAREVKMRRLRDDLLYRIDVVRVCIPPLRDRPADILPLAERFLDELSGGALELSDEARAALLEARWPGNVRQLRNAVRRAAALATGRVVGPELLGIDAPDDLASPPSLERRVDTSERATIAAALAACGGNQTHAARRLGIARRTLIYKMEKHGLKPSRGRPRGGPGDA